MADFVADYLAGKQEARAFFGAALESIFDPERILASNSPARRLDHYRAIGMKPELLATLEKWQEDVPGALNQQASNPLMNTKLVEELKQYQQSLGLERSFSGREHTILTGQQPGLLTGPAYTIYKAISATKLAEEFSRSTGRACVPIFWIAADDHDFEEVRCASLLTRTHEAQNFCYEPAGTVAALPMFRVPLEEALHTIVDEAADAAPGSEFSQEVRVFLHESLDRSNSVSGWFARILARLFRETPLLLFTTELPSARKAAKLLMRQEIEYPLRTTSLVNEAAAALRAQGYPVQLEKHPDECSFFLFEQQRRRKVTYNGSQFILPETGDSYTREELLQRLNEHPEDFSANAALRTVVQQALLHPEAYVAGPGEIAYWAQFQEVFQAYALPMPVVYPRANAVLTTVKLNKLLDKYGLTSEMLLQGVEPCLNHAVLQGSASAALTAVRKEKEVLLHQVAALTETLQQAKASPPLRAMAQTFLEQTRQNLERLELAAAHDDERQVQTVRQQVERLCNTLAPQRKPQERVYTIFSFLFEHGWDLIPRLLKDLDPQRFDLQRIEL